jgi:hypothetical protein
LPFTSKFPNKDGAFQPFRANRSGILTLELIHDMTNIRQIDANRENAKHSSGPTTPEGKKRSSLNAIRHGFTSQTLILTKAETPLHDRHCREYREEFLPKGKVETDFVQELADLRWSINRIRAQETNLLALESEADADDLDNALAVANSARENIKTLALLSIYEQRKMRAYEKTLKMLEERQAARKIKEREDLKDAARILHAYQNVEPNWNSAEDGFVCSRAELLAFNRQEARKEFASRVHCGLEKPAKAA